MWEKGDREKISGVLPSFFMVVMLEDFNSDNIPLKNNENKRKKHTTTPFCPNPILRST